MVAPKVGNVYWYRAIFIAFYKFLVYWFTIRSVGNEATPCTAVAGGSARQPNPAFPSFKTPGRNTITMKSTRNTVKQETPPPAPYRRPPKTSPSPASPEFGEVLDQVLDQIRRELMPLLKPLLEFHQPVETATMDDLKIYWDVRLVRGRDTPYTQMTGRSSLQCVLAPGMLGSLTERIQRELTESIMKPLTSILQGKAIERMEELHAGERAKRVDAPRIGAADHRCDGDGD